MNNLRQRLVYVALEWERDYGNAPSITTVISECDADILLGMSEADYRRAMERATAVQRGQDFVYRGIRIQVKATRPSGKRVSTVAEVPGTRNHVWDQLVWVSYDSEYEIQEAWLWAAGAYEAAFRDVRRLSPADMRKVRPLTRRD